MAEWIDVAVYTIFIATIWAWLPAVSARVTIPLLADRNPAWITEHPGIVQELTANWRSAWSCWLWGASSIAAILALNASDASRRFAWLSGTPKWEALKDLNSLLLIVGLVCVAVYSLLLFRRLQATVPLASHRRAALAPRSVGDHVPRVVRLAVYAAIGLHLAAWVAVGFSDRFLSPAFWAGLGFQFAIAGVFLWLVISAVRRRPGVFDRVFGPAYRRTEVRAVFVAQLIPLLNGSARLYEQLTATTSPDLDRMLHLGLVLLVTALAIAIVGRLPHEHSAPPGRGVATLGALVVVIAFVTRAPLIN